MSAVSSPSATGKINITREFILAGRAVFTVSNPKGEHFTYRVSSPSDANRPLHFIAVLTGPDNENSYTYAGIVREVDGKIALTKASKITKEAKSFQVAEWALGVIWEGKTIPEGYSIVHAGKCGKCGRTLTEPESLETGLGPVCRGKGK